VVNDKHVPHIETAAKIISNIISHRLREIQNESIAIIGTTDYTHAGNHIHYF
jgi:hypothetical protein